MSIPKVAVVAGFIVALLLTGCATSPSTVELDTMHKQSQILIKLDSVITAQKDLAVRQASIERALQEQKTRLDAPSQLEPAILQLSDKQRILDCKITSVAVHERCAVYWQGETDPEMFSTKLKECLVTQGFQDASTCSRIDGVTQR